ncbi:MAG TPA: TlpA disulfide reductase family protein [Burkholderiaceae bacterium]|nr:TlpA disulfide reductase family protein [Burkholderiaceae bacterium]HNB44885.1 TlpA disulfide reductase family protein [Burkholderiaceae bacterium]
MQRITPTVTRRARQLLVCLSLVGATVAAVAATVGQPAPTLDLPGAQGNVSLAAAKGKVVYVDFWASWCGPCRQSFPWMNEMQAKYGPRGLQIIGVNLDAKRDDADKFLAQTPAKFTLAFDSKGDSPRAYGVKGMPTSVLIGADGKVIDHHSGFHDEERKTLEDAIVAALVKAGR